MISIRSLIKKSRESVQQERRSEWGCRPGDCDDNDDWDGCMSE